MSYAIRIKRSAAKELARVSRRDRLYIERAINSLKEHPLSGTLLKGEYRGLRRLRYGDYRIVYAVLASELVVLVVRIAHRREVYRRR